MIAPIEEGVIGHPLVEAAKQFFAEAEVIGAEKLEIDEFKPFCRRWTFPEIVCETKRSGLQFASVRAKRWLTVLHRRMQVGQTYTLQVDFKHLEGGFAIFVSTTLPLNGNGKMNENRPVLRFYYPPLPREAGQIANNIFDHPELCAVTANVIKMATSAVRARVLEMI